MYSSQSTQALLRQMYSSQSTQASLKQIIDKCMAVSPPKPYSHTNKRHVWLLVYPRAYRSRSTQASLPYICLLFIFENFKSQPFRVFLAYIFDENIYAK